MTLPCSLSCLRVLYAEHTTPQGGLDELDDFLLKKIGMLQHCGTDREMLILHGNISKELVCAMRVHLMNETEMNVFCPADSKVFSQNCLDVEFMNFTAISLTNELNMIETFQNTLNNLLYSYPSTYEEDRDFLTEKEQDDNEGGDFGPAFLGAIRLRMREKELLIATLEYLKDHKNKTIHGEVYFQLDLKLLERVESDLRAQKRADFLEAVRHRANSTEPLAVVPVELPSGEVKANLTLLEGMDITQTGESVGISSHIQSVVR